MSDNYSVVGNRAANQINIGSALQTIFTNIPNIEAALTKISGHIGMDVLVSQQAEITEFHAGT